jgi:hypothetical protein
MGIVTAARAVYRAGKAKMVTGTILVKVIFFTMSYRNFSGNAFTIHFRVVCDRTESFRPPQQK